jgi:hypothetical protein
MSGGHYDYLYYRMIELAERIEEELANNGKYINDYDQNEHDLFENIKESVKLETLKYMKVLAVGLREMSEKARQLEFAMEGDTSFEDFIKVMKECA